tara:strand:- start:81 stop:2003 length:1923 start_codon:yes stop_codon:yes gene_type:complete
LNKVNAKLDLLSLNVEITPEEDFDRFDEIIKAVNAAFPLSPIRKESKSFELPISHFLYVCSDLPHQQFFELDTVLNKMLQNHTISREFIDNPPLKIEKNGEEWVQENQDLVDEIRKNLSNSGFKRELLNHQLRDFYQMKHAPHSANFSVPGSGKTSVILSIYSLKNADGPMLVFVPNKGVAKSWIDEIDNCFDEKYKPKIIQLSGPYDNLKKQLQDLKENTVGIITYRQTIANMCFENIYDYASKNQNIYCVLDESHRIKSAIRPGFQQPGKIGTNLLILSRFFERKDILSGTPMTLDINDFISQVEFLYPNLGFKKKLIDNEDSPRRVVDYIFTRTFKNELPLPPTIDHEPIPAEMSKAQSAFYAITVNKLREIYNRLPDQNMFNDLRRAIVRIIELSVDPYNVAKKLKANPNSDKLSQYISENKIIENSLNKLIDEGPVSNKMKIAIEKALEIADSGEKVIIWSYFVNSLDTMDAEIRNNYGIEPLVLKGGVDDDFVINTFNEKNNRLILLANPEKGAEGISLHKNCRNAIYVSRTYKAGQYLQSRDRIHRVGMDVNKEVNYYSVESVYGEGSLIQTIDRRISNNLQSKIKKLANVMNDKELLAVSDYEEMGEEIGSEFNEDDIADFINWLTNQDKLI